MSHCYMECGDLKLITRELVDEFTTSFMCLLEESDHSGYGKRFWFVSLTGNKVNWLLMHDG